MPTKAQIYAQKADETARQITGDYLDWASFLTTASRLYKYSFSDQLLIYAQRPNATACASFDTWNNTMHRYVRRGAKGIALLTPSENGLYLRYVFDVSDTGARQNSRHVEAWVLEDPHMDTVHDVLEAQYGAGAYMMAEQLEQVAVTLAQQYWEEHFEDICDSVDNTPLAEYDMDSIGNSFRSAAAASISYSLQQRCGLDPELFSEDFEEVLKWNTLNALAELGRAVSDGSGQVLRQIERTIRQMERSMNHEREG